MTIPIKVVIDMMIMNSIENILSSIEKIKIIEEIEEYEGWKDEFREEYWAQIIENDYSCMFEYFEHVGIEEAEELKRLIKIREALT